MRIIGGTARGLHLTPVGEGDAKAHLRPTSDRVREAIFNLLINGGYGNPLRDARVLDVFAGTGALGLEALSRGASSAVFLENGPTATALLKRNIALMRAETRTEVLRRDATKPGIQSGCGFRRDLPRPALWQSDGRACLDGPDARGLPRKPLLSGKKAPHPFPPPDSSRLISANTAIPL